MNFADRLNTAIDKKQSCIIAGFDPRPEMIPNIFHKLANKYSKNNQQYIFKLLTEFHGFCLSVIADHVSAIKPNLAFFEAYGLAGLEAFEVLCKEAKGFGLPVIADAKRGDIGSTAEAYAQAFFGESKISERVLSGFAVDALTVNPFLGTDSLNPYLNACKQYGTGLFVLVKTSNSDSAWIQNCKDENGLTVSQKIAQWVDQAGKEFIGECGYSSIGAVVGATYPEEASNLRKLMPKSFFLIPGVGTQGGSIETAKAGFGSDGKGAIINISRALLSSFSDLNSDLDTLRVELNRNILKFKFK
jgi:orotidine-5'-phosphate decarboxylase